MRILITAGEPSGDLHAGKVITALRERFPDAIIEAVGGPEMAAAGAVIRHSIQGLSAIGLIESLDKLPAHVRLLRALRRDFEAKRYDLLITVDYPGFHFYVAESAKKAGIPVLWYIAPQIWAWRPKRARRLARAVDRLAVILPFEAAFFQSKGVDATYVGHPLVDQIAPSREAARSAFGITEQERVLALFPGSRRGEVRRLWPDYRVAARRLLDAGACDRVLVAATAVGEYPDADRLELASGDAGSVLAAADAVLAKSGTTTLEAVLADVPMVVAYRTNAFTFWVGQQVIIAPFTSLPNLIAEREIVPELLQNNVTADTLTNAVMPLLDRSGSVRALQLEGLAEVRRRLGGPGASERVALMAGELLAA